MKNKFLHGAAALAVCAGFVACSEYDQGFSPETLAEVKSLQYETAFVQKYGAIDPEQDWGFGSGAETRATRVLQPSFDFPKDADANKFLSDVPAGVAKLTENAASVNNWIDESWTQDINVYGYWDGSKSVGGTLYIKGNCDFSNRSFYFAGNSELYLVAGATLTLAESNGAGNLQQNTKIYIAEGAKLIAKGELKLNNGLHIYNHGTIEAPNLSTNSNSVLYNSGTVKVDGKISVENDLSVMVNDGTITANVLNTAGSGKFQNNLDVTISGTTFINSNQNAWVNNGQYKTGNFLYNAASDDVINNCRLTVDNEFNMNLGDNPGNGNFKMDAGAGVVTKYFNGGGNWANSYDGTWNAFNGGPFYIYMGAGSVFKVTETATMNATKANYGIYGPETGDYAVFQAKNVVAGAVGQGYEVTYGGNLAVVAEKHFENGYSGSYPYIDFKGSNAKIYATPEETNISIPETDCNPGFNPGKGTTTKTLKESGRVFCEDLGSIGDFDFNDVVFDAYVYSDGSAKIVLWAAGGTLPITVAGFDPHSELGSGMVNTGVKTGLKESYEFTKPAGTYTCIKDIPVVVRQTDEAGEEQEILLKTETGQAPQKICVPLDTRWALEYKSIELAYPKFKEWVKDRTVNAFSEGTTEYLY